jgi:hypothetical protein
MQRHGDPSEPQWAATRICGSPHHHYSPHQLSYTTSTTLELLPKLVLRMLAHVPSLRSQL